MDCQRPHVVRMKFCLRAFVKSRNLARRVLIIFVLPQALSAQRESGVSPGEGKLTMGISWLPSMCERRWDEVGLDGALRREEVLVDIGKGQIGISILASTDPTASCFEGWRERKEEREQAEKVRELQAMRKERAGGAFDDLVVGL